MLLLAAAALLVRCASAIPAANHAIPGAALMTLEKFADHGEPDALCMDGSSSGIYFAPATTQPDHYVLYLQGGGWCNDEASCKLRCGIRFNDGKCTGQLATSTRWASAHWASTVFPSSRRRT